MNSALARFATFLFLAAALTGCQTTSAYRWGATDDPQWAPRIGSARLGEVTRVLGQPHEKLVGAGGETKMRWAGQALTVDPEPGTMQDYSVQRSDQRQQWHDMIFSKDGVLLRAWLSDQRRLSDSEAP